MTEKYFDWKGNEIKAGMTIYFVKTEVGGIESCRMGVMIPDGAGDFRQHWEDENVWQERKNREVWELGQPYLVEKKENSLFYTTMPNEEGYTFSFHFSCAYLAGGNPTIAIKGISENKK